MTVSRPGARRKGGIRVRTDTPNRSRRLLALPAGFAAALAVFALLPAARENDTLRASILGASGLLLAAIAALWAVSRQRRFGIEVSLRPQHYVQACAHTSIFLYWGWHWPPVYAMAPLIVAQLVFAYAFDMLLNWSRRDVFQLGFGPFPIILSTNLFLWFRHDWFYLQFLMIAVGFVGKDLIRWHKEGRLTHVFNPSSFSLSVFSIALILTGHTSWTWGPDIAITQFNPPQMYLFLFLIALPGQFFFGVTTMTMSAVLTTYLLGLAWFSVTGTYYFIDTYVPIAVFLGMHLLFTDPSTAPRTELGRVVFGTIYGVSVFVLYSVLGWLGVPTFYDKLLPVPLMNLSVRFIDRVVPLLPRLLNPASLAPAVAGRRRNLAWIGLWTTIFVAMSSVQGVGDAHPGHRTPFWVNACRADLYRACDGLGVILNQYCGQGSGWACNERGVLRSRGKLRGQTEAPADFARACGLGFRAGCQNAVAAGVTPPPAAVSAEPRLEDFPIVLQLGKGPLPDNTPLELYSRACEQGWMSGCNELGGLYLLGSGVARDPGRAAAELGKACEGGLAAACSNLGLMYYQGDGVLLDRPKAVGYQERACRLGAPNACAWLANARQDEGVRGGSR